MPVGYAAVRRIGVADKHRSILLSAGKGGVHTSIYCLIFFPTAARFDRMALIIYEPSWKKKDECFICEKKTRRLKNIERAGKNVVEV